MDHVMAAPTISKSEAVYQELRERILAGRYSGGYRLVLSQVAKELNVSAVPVREALRRLEAERLVRYTQNIGAEVLAINVEDYREAMQILAILEGAAQAMSAPLLTPEQRRAAADINEQMRVMADSPGFDPGEFSHLNQLFHQTLCQACPNAGLASMLTSQGERVMIMRRNLFQFEPDRSLRSVAEHDHLLELIERAAPMAELEAAGRAHKLRTLEESVRAETVP